LCFDKRKIKGQNSAVGKIIVIKTEPNCSIVIFIIKNESFLRLVDFFYDAT